MKISVGPTMFEALITARCLESLCSAFKKMRELRIRHLPVIDDEGSGGLFLIVIFNGLCGRSNRAGTYNSPIGKLVSSLTDFGI